MNDLFSELSVGNNLNVFEGKLLKNIEISNYRSIGYENIELSEKGVLLRGKNGVGKTSIIEAVYFLFSGKLFDGRAKLIDQNITPTTAPKGTKTSIKVTFATGFTFAGTFWEEYNDDQTVVVERKSVYEVNGAVVKKVSDAYNALYNELGILDIISRFKTDPTLKSIDVVRMLYDSGYLKDIDYKDLRALVIDIVGDVDYAQIINENPTKYTPLVKPLKESNMDLEAVKQRIRGEIKGTPSAPSGLETQITNIEFAIQESQKEVNAKINLADVEKAKLEIKLIDEKILKLRANKDKGKEDLTKSIDLEISNLEQEQLKLKEKVREKHYIELERVKKHNEDLEKTLQSRKTDIDNTKNKIVEIDNQINTEQAQLNNILNNKKQKQDLKQNLEIQRNTLGEEWKKLNNPTSEIITSPVHKERFHLHEALEYAEIRNKKLSEITEKGKTVKNKIESLIESIETHTNEEREQKKVIVDLQEKRMQLKTKLDNLIRYYEEEKASINNKKLLEPTLDFNTNEYIKLQDDIIKLQNKRQLILENGNFNVADYDKQILDLENEKIPHQEIVNKLAVRESRVEAIERYTEELKTVRKRLQSSKELLILIKELEKDKFTKIDSKIANKFGENIKFKLFDYNADESLNIRVCDLLVKDGNGAWVNIKDINTGNYPLAVLDFITRIKEHYGVKKSFMFIDEYGTIDDDNRNRIYGFGEQIIATEKGNTKKIEVSLL